MRLAHLSGVSRQHVYRLRNGVMEPTRPVINWLTEACSMILRKHVHASELFDLGDDE
jgi:transcriptional regulator with XRE-family HTH domain